MRADEIDPSVRSDAAESAFSCLVCLFWSPRGALRVATVFFDLEIIIICTCGSSIHIISLIHWHARSKLMRTSIFNLSNMYTSLCKNSKSVLINKCLIFNSGLLYYLLAYPLKRCMGRFFFSLIYSSL